MTVSPHRIHGATALAAYYIIAHAAASSSLACCDGVRFGLRDLSAK